MNYVNVTGIRCAYCSAKKKKENKMSTDKELLDFLEKLNDEATYTGRCELRMSTIGRGWRLHETSGNGTSNTVREAIEKFKSEFNKKND